MLTSYSFRLLQPNLASIRLIEIRSIAVSTSEFDEAATGLVSSTVLTTSRKLNKSVVSSSTTTEMVRELLLIDEMMFTTENEEFNELTTIFNRLPEEC